MNPVCSSARETIVVAMSRERVIGCNGRLPWHAPEELRLFRNITLGGTVIMGRRTWESLGHPLAQRRNLVISSTLAPQPGMLLCRSFNEAVATALALPEPIFYICGASVYAAALQRAQALRVSWMKTSCSGTVYFPEIDPCCWELVCETDYAAFVHAEYCRRR